MPGPAPSAKETILGALQPNEQVEAVVIGQWWGNWGAEDLSTRDTDEYDEPWLVPPRKREVLLSWEDAAPLLEAWPLDGDIGSASVYPLYIWTNKRVLFITTYDGATWLDSVPRNPMACLPNLKGR